MTIRPPLRRFSTATRMRRPAPPSPICRRRATTMTTTPAWPSRSARPNAPARDEGSPHLYERGVGPPGTRRLTLTPPRP